MILLRIPLVLWLTLTASVALAEKADRGKPVNLEADKVTVDDRNKVHVYEGNVVLSQGTLIIRAGKVVVTQDLAGYQRGVAYAPAGGLAKFRQKREGRDDYVDGEGERIEHDAKSEITQFFNKAWVRSGQDEVRGEYIQYNGLTENYLVTNGPNATVIPGQQGGNRVRAVIMPKSGTSPAGSPDAQAAPQPPAAAKTKPKQ